VKRWVAKESTDNGQVVEDSKLTDQAIFDRLERDVAFRSVATRLLQRYGYLVPTTNPDSDFAKEKQLVLQERARRLVQIEAQEDSESLRPQKNDRDLERTGTCDPRRDQDCLPQSPANRQNTRVPNGMSTPETNPQATPEQAPTQRQPQILRADGLPPDTDLLGGTSADSLAPNLQMTSGLVKRDANPLTGFQSQGQGLNDTLPLTRSLPSAPVDRSANTAFRWQERNRAAVARKVSKGNGENSAGRHVHRRDSRTPWIPSARRLLYSALAHRNAVFALRSTGAEGKLLVSGKVSFSPCP